MATENTPTVPVTPEAPTPDQPTTPMPTIQNEGDATPPADDAAAPTGLDIGSTSEPSWRDSLPEDLRKHEKLAGFKSVEELAKAHAESQLAAAIPDAEGYRLPENFPIKDIGKWANHVKLSQDQLDHILKLNEHISVEQVKNTDKMYAAGLKVLFDGWGEAKTENIRLAQQFLNHFDKSGDVKALLRDSRAGNHPAIVNFFAEVGKTLMKEDWFVPSGNTSGASKEVSAADTIFDGK